MSRFGRGVMMLMLGTVLARLVWSGGFGWFVQQHMRFPLSAAAVVLLIFGGYEMAAVRQQDAIGPESRGRSRGPLVGWLLALPLFVLYSIAPTGLGAAAADRVDAYNPTEATSRYESLADGSNGQPVAMDVFEFLDRAIWDPNRSLEGNIVRLEGLVVNDEGLPDGFRLTRFMVSCCAADGVPLQVVIHDTGQTLANDTWVTVDVQWRPPSVPYPDLTTPWFVEADAVTVNVVPIPPDDPYESPY